MRHDRKRFIWPSIWEPRAAGVLAGLFDGSRLTLEELHRFENAAVSVADSLQWDVLRLWEEVRRGLRSGAGKFESAARSCGIDTWGVDFALAGARRHAAWAIRYSYRDRRSRWHARRAF